MLKILFLVASVHALTLDSDKGNTTFRVDGAVVTADQAVRAELAGKAVYRCKPKKLNGNKIFFANGKATTEAVECTRVHLVLNPRTGAPRWKVKK